MTTSPSSALPANPLRPFNAETCEEARARLAEAQAGSSLISDDENAAAVRLAEDQVRRLCDDTAPATPDTKPLDPQ